MSASLDIQAFREQMARDRAALRGEAETPASEAAQPAPARSGDLPGHPAAPAAATPVFSRPEGYVPGKRCVAARPSAAPSASSEGIIAVEPVPLSARLHWLHLHWHTALAALFGMIGLASQTAPQLIPGLGAGDGMGWKAGLFVGGVSFAMAFFGLRKFRRTVRNAASLFDTGTRSTGYWVVAVLVFCAMMQWSLSGGVEGAMFADMMTEEARAEMQSLSRSPREWLWLVVKSLAVAMIAARLAQNKVFSRD